MFNDRGAANPREYRCCFGAYLTAGTWCCIGPEFFGGFYLLSRVIIVRHEISAVYVCLCTHFGACKSGTDTLISVIMVLV